jgi:hypothetical protein
MARPPSSEFEEEVGQPIFGGTDPVFVSRSQAILECVHCLDHAKTVHGRQPERVLVCYT